MRKITKRSAAIAAAAVLAVGAAGGAYAAGWLVAGEGTASASADTAKPISATVTLASGVKLAPGTERNAVVTFTNPNDFAVAASWDDSKAPVGKPVLTITDALGGTACNIRNSKVTASYPASVKVPANAANLVVPTTLKVRMGIDADNACQNAVFTFNYVLKGEATTIS